MSRFRDPPQRSALNTTPDIRRRHWHDPQFRQRMLFADWLAARHRHLRVPREALRTYLKERGVLSNREKLTPIKMRVITQHFGLEAGTLLYGITLIPLDELIARLRECRSDPEMYIDGVPEGSRYYRPPPGPLTPLRRTPDPWELEEARLMQIELRTIAANDQQEHREQFAAWLGDRADVVSPRRMYKQWRGVAVEHPTHGWSRGMRPHARLGRDVHEQLGAKLVDLISMSPPIKRSLLRAILDPPPETPPCT